VDRGLRAPEHLDDRQRVRPDRARQGHPLDDVDDVRVRSARAVTLGVGVVVVAVGVWLFVVGVSVVVGTSVVAGVVTRPVAVAIGVGYQHLDARGGDATAVHLGDGVLDRECGLDRRQGLAVGPGGQQRPQKHVAGGTHAAVESECSHTQGVAPRE
jgi:hypothetical protein